MMERRLQSVEPSRPPLVAEGLHNQPPRIAQGGRNNCNFTTCQQIDRAFVYCPAIAPCRRRGRALSRARHGRCGQRQMGPLSEKHVFADVGARGAHVARLERCAVAVFDRTLFVSEAERRTSLAFAPRARAAGLVRQPRRCRLFRAGSKLRFALLAGATGVAFTGTMDYRPNGVRWLASPSRCNSRASQPREWKDRRPVRPLVSSVQAHPG
jgi:hypothetical protein